MVKHLFEKQKIPGPASPSPVKGLGNRRCERLWRATASGDGHKPKKRHLNLVPGLG